MKRVVDINDPRLDPYRDLKHNKYPEESTYFIAEGRLVVERLLNTDFEVESILLSSQSTDEAEWLAGVSCPVLSVAPEVCQQLVGFPFHRGVLACGGRIIRRQLDFQGVSSSSLLICCPETALAENLGAMIRSGVALGAEGVLLGATTIDPFSRRSIRTSMGNCFRLPISQPHDLGAELARLKGCHGFDTIGLSLKPAAVNITQLKFPPRTILMFGNEGHGLRSEHASMCDRHVKIPMSEGVDSLNVAAAAAISMFAYRQSISLEPSHE